jgi:predicted nuclease of restriction endonuclease-like (RecB) superfamily
MLTNMQEYAEIVSSIKEQIKTTQQRTLLNANRELVLLYWNTGKTINEYKKWGNNFIENLARDIKVDFPGIRGFSERNLKYMAKFYNTFDNLEFVQQAVAQLPWRHSIYLMEKVKDKSARNWYVEKTIENGWSSNILALQIDTNLYERQAVADKTTNFTERLPSPQSELAQQTLKDPYIFDFIEFREGMIERDVEKALIGNITNLLLELGKGFSYVGRQYHLEVENEDFYIDLLFYHLELRCYIVIDLKMGDFKPEYAGKMNFYISAVDEQLKKPADSPTIGILLCRKKKKLIAEYALRNLQTPIGVSEFKMTSVLPKELENILPTAEDIESRLRLPNEESWEE